MRPAFAVSLLAFLNFINEASAQPTTGTLKVSGKSYSVRFAVACEETHPKKADKTLVNVFFYTQKPTRPVDCSTARELVSKLFADTKEPIFLASVTAPDNYWDRGFVYANSSNISYTYGLKPKIHFDGEISGGRVKGRFWVDGTIDLMDEGQGQIDATVDIPYLPVKRAGR